MGAIQSSFGLSDIFGQASLHLVQGAASIGAAAGIVILSVAIGRWAARRGRRLRASVRRAHRGV